jgi:mannosyltransferase
MAARAIEAAVIPGRERSRWETSRTAVETVVLACATFALGLIRLSSHVSMWMDEAATARVIDRSFGSMAAILLTKEAGMGPYYVSLWIWARFGNGDSFIRAWSIVGSVVAVLLVHRLALRWMSRPAALAVPVLLLMSQFLHQYQTEARSYSWLVAAAIALALAGDSFRRRPGVGEAAVLGVVVGLGVALSPLFILWLGSLALAGAVAPNHTAPSRRSVALVLLAAAASAAPFLPAMLVQTKQLNWIQRPTLLDLLQTTSGLDGGNTVTVVLLLGGIILAGALARHPGYRKEFRLVAPILLAVLPVIVLGGVSITVKPLFIRRYLGCSVPFIIIASIQGWTLLSRRASRRGIAATVSVLTMLFLVSSPTSDWNRGEDLRAAAIYLDGHLQVGDVVVFGPRWMRTPFFRYWGERPDVDVAFPIEPDSYNEEDNVTPAVLKSIVSAPRVWVVGDNTLSPAPTDAVVQFGDDLRSRRVIDKVSVGGVDMTLLGS